MLVPEIPPPSAYQLVQDCEKEDAVTITSNEKARIFTCPYALEVPLRKVGTAEDLLKLRQVNQNSYEMLNRPCLDLAKLAILLGPKDPDPVESEEEEEDEIDAYHYPKTPSSEFFLVSTLNGKLIDIVQGTNLKHIYRSFIFVHPILDDKMIKICTQFFPYITKLTMMRFLDSKEWTLTDFINQFPMLKEICLMIKAFNKNEENNPMPFELDLDSLKFNPKPKITLEVSSWHDEILTKFGTHPNTYIELNIVRSQNQLTTLQLFHILSTKFGHLKHLKFTDFKFGEEDIIDTLDNLKLLTRLFLKHGKHIEQLKFYFSLSPTTTEAENEIKECFVSLSPFVTGLTLGYNSSSTTQIVNLSCEWPKLEILEIYIHGFEGPIEILKHCPNLEKMVLTGLAQDLCFFSNHERSYKQNLQYYFGNLNHLESLVMHWQYGNVIRERHLDNYLRGLLPALRYYQNLTPN